MYQLDLFPPQEAAPTSRQAAQNAGFRLLYGPPSSPSSEPDARLTRDDERHDHDVED